MLTPFFLFPFWIDIKNALFFSRPRTKSLFLRFFFCHSPAYCSTCCVLCCKVELLVREGASVDFETPNGRTPLVECAKHGSVEPLRFLMECGAKLNLVTKQKATAFDWALNSGQSRALRHLVRILHSYYSYCVLPYCCCTSVLRWTTI